MSATRVFTRLSFLWAVLLGGVLFVGSAACQGASCPSGQLGAKLLEQQMCIELATTPATRNRGLMHRKELPEKYGMLFVFPRETHTGFWMKNTYVPLSIAFLDEERRIQQIMDMEPETEDLHRPNEPFEYALEVPQGWFERHGIEAGDRLVIDLRGVEAR